MANAKVRITHHDAPQRKLNFSFLLVMIIIFALGLITLIKSPTLISTEENRTLTQFSQPNLDTFLDGTYQNQLETALADQFPASEKVKQLYGYAKQNLPTFGLAEQICAGKYLSLDSERATFNCEHYIVYRPQVLAENPTVTDNLAKFHQMNHRLSRKEIPVYYYAVNDSEVFNFENNQSSTDFKQLLSEAFSGDDYQFAEFNFANYDEYKQLFYQSDHHWNYRGSYQAYTEILDLLGVKSAPLEPTETVAWDEPTYGSHAKLLRLFDPAYSDNFTMYQFNFPRHTTHANEIKLDDYGRADDFFAHNYTYNQYDNYYGLYYGSDYAEVELNYDNPGAGNLLIISNSFDNAILKLLASHFNRTYSVDLRRYEAAYNQEFILSDYVKKRDIDQVLVLTSAQTLADPAQSQGVDK